MKTLVALALLLALAGCADRDDTTHDTAEEPEPTMTHSSQPAFVHAAIADLAEREGVSEDEVTVVSREEVTWRDGSLGCAKPDMMYTQALVEGSRIVLSVAGRDFEYHAGGSRAPFLCERPTQ